MNEYSQEKGKDLKIYPRNSDNLPIKTCYDEQHNRQARN